MAFGALINVLCRALFALLLKMRLSSDSAWDQCYDFKNVFTENSAEKNRRFC
jgi:hypothetical protein